LYVFRDRRVIEGQHGPADTCALRPAVYAAPCAETSAGPLRICIVSRSRKSATAQRGLSALKRIRGPGGAVAERSEANHEAQAEGRVVALCAFELPLWEAGDRPVGGRDEVGMARFGR